MDVDSDAEVARLVAENEPKPSSGPNKAKAEEVVVVKKRIEEGLKCPFSVLDAPANSSCRFFAVINGLKHYDPALLDECTCGPEEQRVLQLRHQVGKHLLQNAHCNMACPDGEMTNAEHLYSMSFEDGVCGTNGLRQRGSPTESASSVATTAIRRNVVFPRVGEVGPTTI
eukprot:5926985-Pleurochrysis_carterae.AAC.2